MENNEEVLFKHNWLYSVVPDFPVITTNTIEKFGGIYLAGYCKYCNKVFTVKLLTDAVDNVVQLSQLDIPKFGCIDPREII